jgi:hypothetical protein
VTRRYVPGPEAADPEGEYFSSHQGRRLGVVVRERRRWFRPGYLVRLMGTPGIHWVSGETVDNHRARLEDWDHYPGSGRWIRVAARKVAEQQLGE